MKQQYRLYENQRVTNNAVYFFGGKSPFSNFFEGDQPVNFRGVEFPTSEHAFMYAKAIFFSDKYHANKIIGAVSPKQAKYFGRQVRNFDEQEWNKHRLNFMIEVLAAKFKEPLMKSLLLQTEDKQFVEGSPYDKIWGVGLAYWDDKILDSKNWNGLNLLGEALMTVRELLRSNQI